jgi:hypothetical protein
VPARIPLLRFQPSRSGAGLGATGALLPLVWSVPIILVVTMGPDVIRFVQVLLPVVH